MCIIQFFVTNIGIMILVRDKKNEHSDLIDFKDCTYQFIS